MNAFHATYAVLFAGAGIACAGSLVQVRQLQSRPVRRGLAGLLVLSGLWGFAVVAQFLLPSLAGKKLAYTTGLVFGFGTVFAWLYFVSAYTGRRYHRDERLVWTAVGVYALATVVKATNPIHGAYFTATLSARPFPHMVIDHGGLHWLTMGIAYALSGVGFWVLYDAFRDEETPLRLYLLVGATALPVVPNLVAAAFPDLLLQVNYEPLAVAVFAIGVLFFAQDSFLELSSPGQTQLVDALSEGVLLVDEEGRVVSHNGHAEEAFPALARGEETLAAVDETLASLAVGDRRVVTRTVDGTTRHFQATKKTIDAGPQFITTAVTLTDVTRLVHLEEITTLHSKINEAIIEEGTKREIKERICEELAAASFYRFAWYGHVGEDGVTPAYTAGPADAYLDSLDPDADGDADPVVDVLTDTDSYPGIVDVEPEAASGWHRAASEMGVTACLTISLEPGSDGGGVMGIYTTDADGFSESERTMFAEIRETLQHAISALETHEEARRFQKAVNEAGYALFIMDVDGTIRYVNPAFEETTGYSASEAIGQTPALLADDKSSRESEMWDAIESGTLWEGEVRNRRKSGDRYWARRTVAPVTDDDGALTAMVAIEVDVTTRRVRQQRLTVLNRILRHNLRNRMNVISGNAHLMLNRSEDDTLQEPAEQIQDTATDMIELSEKAHRAEQLIESGESESGHIELTDMVANVRADLQSTVPDENVDVSLHSNGTVPVDAALEPALLELTDNAVEHTDGDPHVEIRATADTEEVTIEVADDGPGLPPEERRVVEDGDESSLEHGSGLGLWLVNWLVVQCGGTLAIEADDSGTTVTVRAPVRAEASTAAARSSTR